VDKAGKCRKIQFYNLNYEYYFAAGSENSAFRYWLILSNAALGIGNGLPGPKLKMQTGATIRPDGTTHLDAFTTASSGQYPHNAGSGELSSGEIGILDDPLTFSNTQYLFMVRDFVDYAGEAGISGVIGIRLTMRLTTIFYCEGYGRRRTWQKSICLGTCKNGDPSAPLLHNRKGFDYSILTSPEPLGPTTSNGTSGGLPELGPDEAEAVARWQAGRPGASL
jgi:hypothetical protein